MEALVSTNISREKSKDGSLILSNKVGFLLVFLLLYLSYNTGNQMRWDRRIMAIVTFVVVVLFFLYAVFFKRPRIHLKAIVSGMALTGVSLVGMVVYGDFAPDNFVFLMVLWCGIMVAHLLTFEQFTQSFIRIMIILCLYSLLCSYVLMPLVMNAGLSVFNTVINPNGNVPFVDFIFSFSLKYFGIQRNYGLFREPGVYQVFILAALAMELFMSRQKLRIFRLVVLLGTLITTFSTIGIVCGMLMITLYILPRLSKRPIKILIGILVGAVAVIIIVGGSEDLQDLLSRSMNKLLDPADISFRVRFESIFNSLYASLQNPVFGLSLNNSLAYIIENLNAFGTTDVTGTTAIVFAGLGWPMGILVNVLLFRFCHINLTVKNGLLACGLFVILFLSINTQNLLCNSVFWTFLFMAYMKREETDTTEEGGARGQYEVCSVLRQ